MNKSEQKERAIKVIQNIVLMYEPFNCDEVGDQYVTKKIAEHIIKNLRKNNIIPPWKY